MALWGIAVGLGILILFLFAKQWAEAVYASNQEFLVVSTHFQQALYHSLKSMRDEKYDDMEFYIQSAERHVSRYAPKDNAGITWREKMTLLVRDMRLLTKLHEMGDHDDAVIVLYSIMHRVQELKAYTKSLREEYKGMP